MERRRAFLGHTRVLVSELLNGFSSRGFCFEIAQDKSSNKQIKAIHFNQQIKAIHQQAYQDNSYTSRSRQFILISL